MSRQTEEILERYRAAQSLGEADRARLFGAIQERIAGSAAGGSSGPGAAHGNVAGSLAKTTSILPKIILGLALAAAPATWLARGHMAHLAPHNASPSSAKMAPGCAPGVHGECASDTPSAPAAALATASAWTPVTAATFAPTPAWAAAPEPGSASEGTLSARRVSQGSHKSRDGLTRASSDPARVAAPSDPAPARVAAPSDPALDTAAASPSTSDLVAQLAAVPTPILAPQTALASQRAPSAQPALAPPSQTPPASTPSPAASGPSEVDEEVRLVGLAYSLLHDGAPAKALVVLEEHERRFPNGKLAESRRVTRILALCQSGRTADARAERDRFLSRYPRSPFTNRVRTSCGDPP